MFKRILVAVDGSAASNAGLRVAVGLCKDQDATLVAAHVMDDAVLPVDPEGSFYPGAYLDSFYESQQKEGERLVAQAAGQAKAAGVDCETVLARSRASTVADVIVSLVRKKKADVIVLGTHGRRGLRRMLMGSDAEAIMREASVPVMLVRGGYAARVAGKARPSASKRAQPSRAAA